MFCTETNFKMRALFHRFNFTGYKEHLKLFRILFVCFTSFLCKLDESRLSNKNMYIYNMVLDHYHF